MGQMTGIQNFEVCMCLKYTLHFIWCVLGLFFSRCSVLVRMIGVTVESVNLRLLLRSLCAQMCRIYGGKLADIPQVYIMRTNGIGLLLGRYHIRHQSLYSTLARVTG